MGYQIAKWLKCEKKSWILWMEFLNTKVLELPKWLIIEHICWILIWEYHKFGQCCDIQKSGIKFGAISELKFARNSILLKVHVSKWYRKCFWTMLNYGLMSRKIRSFDGDDEFVDLPEQIYTFFSQYFF